MTRDLLITTFPNDVVVTLTHIPDGMDFLNGGRIKPGYYLRAYRQDAPYKTIKSLIEPAKRFGPTKMQKVLKVILKPNTEANIKYSLFLKKISVTWG